MTDWIRVIKIDIVCLVNVGRGIIFGPNKDLRIVSKPMVGLSASAILDKRAKPDADYSPDKKRSPSPKPEKGSKGDWGSGGRGDVSVAVLSKRKGVADRPGTSRGY